MKKLLATAATTLTLILSTTSLSYAAQPTTPTAFTPTQLPPQTVQQSITELKTTGIPYETINDADETKTIFRFRQGFSFTIAEPKPKPVTSAFILPGWDLGGPYILLNSFDVDMIVGGQSWAVGSIICATPGIGWGTCSVIGLALLTANNTIRSHWGNPCPGKNMKIHFVPPRYSGCA